MAAVDPDAALIGGLCDQVLRQRVIIRYLRGVIAFQGRIIALLLDEDGDGDGDDPG